MLPLQSTAVSATLMKGLLRLPAFPGRLPDRVIESLFALRRRSAGLVRKHIRVGRFELPYLTGGEGEPVVLLHGFADSKDSFVDVARSLTDHYRVFLPDLPGFGEASAPLDVTYSLPELGYLISRFCDVVTGPCHLGGNSLGGAVAAYVAMERPELVNSLGLVAAAGLVMPTPSPLQLELDAGNNPFVIETLDEYRAWSRFVMEVPPTVPPAVQRYMGERFIARGPLHAKIMDDLLAGDFDMTPRLAEVSARTLVLWGDCDRLIDLSVGRLYAERVADASLVILHGVGHVPQYERPARTGRLIRRFLDG